MNVDHAMPVVRPLLEVCIDSVAGAQAAEQGGADRLELCANLLEGGTTPSTGMIRSVLAATSLPVMVMIRPRGGHFTFDAQEQQVMYREAEAVLREGVAGIVIGALRTDGSVDDAYCRRLLELRGQCSVTFHRAFDQVADPFAALETLVSLGVDRILTSGLAPTALEGISLLRELHDCARGRISIMPGCGVRSNNAAEILRETGAREIHASASILSDTPVAFWREAIPMHAAAVVKDQQRRVTAVEQVAALRRIIG